MIDEGLRAIQVLRSCGWERRVPLRPPPKVIGGFELTGEYITLLKWTNGGACQLGNNPLSLVELWTIDELDTLQALVVQFMPEGLSIGGDGGTREFVMDYRGGRPGSIYSVDRGDPGWECESLRKLGDCLGEALETIRSTPLDVDHPARIGAAAL